MHTNKKGFIVRHPRQVKVPSGFLIAKGRPPTAQERKEDREYQRMITNMRAAQGGKP